MTESAPTVLDACVCINLAAALEGSPSMLLGCRPVIVPQVAAETMYLLVPHNDEEIQLAVPTDGLDVVQLTDTEIEIYVHLASRLDDGEAASMAVASSRGWTLATDDRAARKAAAALEPRVPVATTPVLLRKHAVAAGWDRVRISRAVRTVETQARFQAPRDDHEHTWWTDHQPRR